MKKGKLEYLEGFKGWACLCVLLCHFLSAFYLTLYNCVPEYANTGTQLELIMGKTPLNIFYSGNFGVRVFFLISGFVLSYKFFTSKDENSAMLYLRKSAVKRYFRLIIPVTIANAAAWILMEAGAYHNQLAGIIAKSKTWLSPFNNFDPDFMMMVKENFFGNFFLYEANYVSPLWTMTYEMLGSLLVFAVLALIGKVKARYAFYIVFLMIFRVSNYSHFILGMAMCDIMCNKPEFMEKVRKKQWLVWLLFIAGFYLGSYPSGVGPENSVYSFLNVPFIANKVVFYHLVGAVMMIFALLNSNLLQKFFESRPLAYLGKHSFSLYLVHWPVMATFSCWFLFKLSGEGLTYNQIMAINFVLTMLIIFPVSMLMTKYADRAGTRFANWIANKV